MTSAAQGQSELAFLYGANGSKNLVMCRDYGDITSVILDDSAINETSILRIPTKHYAEFLESFCEGVLVKGLDAHYNAIDLYLLAMNQPVLGPLTAARAVLSMEHNKCSPAAAIQLANDERKMLTKRQTERLKRVDAIIEAA